MHTVQRNCYSCVLQRALQTIIHTLGAYLPAMQAATPEATLGRCSRGRRPQLTRPPLVSHPQAGLTGKRQLP